MRAFHLPFSRPSIGNDEIAEVVDTLRSDWITTGPKVKRFEREFASFVNAPAALALSSCTAALHLALIAQGVGPGDEVITTPMTFCSGVHAIEQAGARPVLVDVEPDTLNIDPAKIIAKIEELTQTDRIKNVKAILPVHLFGHPCEMSQLLKIAQLHRLAVIEDAAHAIPAAYRGQMIGSAMPSGGVPLLTCFSFYATKNLTTAEGGMLTGNTDAIDEARLWSLHGMSRDAWKRYGAEGSWHYEVIRPGFKYNMTDIQAAIGIHQLRKQESFHARRQKIAQKYTEAFLQFDSLETPSIRPYVDHSWHLYVLRLHLDRLSISREQFIQELSARKIGSSVHFIPIHVHPYFRDKYGFKLGDFPIAEREYQRMASLPLYPGMSDQDVEDVIEAVSDIVRIYHTRSAMPVATVPQVVPEESISLSKISQPAHKIAKAFHRAFDVTSATLALFLLVPIFAIIAAAIISEDHGPVFYSQRRVGRGLRKFWLYKFRSMAPDSARAGRLTAPDDRRITRVGRRLRQYKLDELPQLFNVLKGDMQLVGPRPELDHYVDSFSGQYRELLKDRPGITDLASLTFRNEADHFHDGPLENQYVDRILPEKLRLSLKYSRTRTFVSDLRLLIHTVLGLKSLKVE